MIGSADAEFMRTREMARSLVGISEMAAIERAVEGGRVVRIGQRDEVWFGLTDEFNPRRVTMFLRDDIVDRAEAT